MHASEPLGNVVIAIVVLYCLVMLGNWAIAIAIVIGVMCMHQHQKNVLYSMHRRVCTLEEQAVMLEEQAVKLQTMPRRVRALERDNAVECALYAVPVGRRHPMNEAAAVVSSASVRESVQYQMLDAHELEDHHVHRTA